MIPEKKPYFITRQNKKVVNAIMKVRKTHPVNIIVSGKHGMGKSELARQIAAQYGMDYEFIPYCITQESEQLIGTNQLKDGATTFNISEFGKAIQRPNSLVHLEEINRPDSPKAHNVLFPILDDARMFRHDKLGVVKVANGVVFVATCNEGFEYTGTDNLDEALRDRFFQLSLDYLPLEVETNLVVIRTGLVGDVVASLVKFVSSLRADAKNPIHISTRRILMMAELIQGGISVQDAIVSCVAMDKKKLQDVLLTFDFDGKFKNGEAPKLDAYGKPLSQWELF